MSEHSLEAVITNAWEQRDSLSPSTTGLVRAAVDAVMGELDAGRLRVAEKVGPSWKVNVWVKQAVLLSFRLTGATVMPGAAGPWFDKVPLKFNGWDEARFQSAGIRAVPGAMVRRSAFIEAGAVIMPSFVNVGARVGAGTMIDTWATVGSCAQVGRNCHISHGVGVGGVLEPLQAAPTIIEDDCFIGISSGVAEGMIVETGAVISMGVFLGASTPIIDRATGEETRGRIPAYAVVVPGTRPGAPLPDGRPGPGLSCAVIVKRVDAGTRARTSINELLRD